MKDSLASWSAEEEAQRKPLPDLSENRPPDWSFDHINLDLAASRAAGIVRRYTAYDRLRVFRILETTTPDQCRAEEVFDSERVREGDRSSTSPCAEDPYGFGLERWIEQLAGGRVVGGSVHKFPRSERRTLAARGLRALIAMPIRGRDERIWGFACFEAVEHDVQVDEDSLALLYLMVSVMRKAVLRQESAAAAPATDGPARDDRGKRPSSPEAGSLQAGSKNEEKTSKTSGVVLGSIEQNPELDRALVRVSRLLMAVEPDLEDVLRTVGSAIGAESGYLVRVSQVSRTEVVSWIQAGRGEGDRGDGSTWPDDGMLGLSSSCFYDLSDHDAKAGSERSVVPVLSQDDTLLGFIVYTFSDKTSRRLVDSMRILSVLGDLLAAHFERAQAREDLSESEERWRSLIETHPDAFLFIQEETIVYANSSAVRTFGCRSESDVIGRSFADFISASEYDAFKARAEASIDGECSALWEHDIIRLDGEHRLVESCCIGLMYRGKRSLQITLRDITEKRRSEEGYRRFFAAIDEGIARIDITRPLYADVFPDIQLAHILKHGRLAELNSAMKNIFEFDDSAKDAPIESLNPNFVGIVSKVVSSRYALRGEDVKIAGSDGKKYLMVNATAAIIRNKVASVWITCVDRTTKVQLEKTMIKALEDQQQRIGRDLHDGVGQLLTGARILSQSLVEKLEVRNVDASTARKIARYAQDASEQISTIYRGLTPVGLFHQDIGETLYELTMSIDGLPGVSATFESDCDLPIQDNETRLHMYRIAQEAVNNSLKHSGARHICISITEERDAFAVRITDDGCGLPSVKQNSGQIGLASMEYRAHAIGADLSVGSPSKGGTVVTCRLPKGAA